MLPGMDGLEVCRRIRENGPVPVIMLTARRTPRPGPQRAPRHPPRHRTPPDHRRVRPAGVLPAQARAGDEPRGVDAPGLGRGVRRPVHHHRPRTTPAGEDRGRPGTATADQHRVGRGPPLRPSPDRARHRRTNPTGRSRAGHQRSCAAASRPTSGARWCATPPAAAASRSACPPLSEEPTGAEPAPREKRGRPFRLRRGRRRPVGSVSPLAAGPSRTPSFRPRRRPAASSPVRRAACVTRR